MDYYTREQIPILAFDEDPESIARELIRQALCEKPCNIVFIEVRGKLSGVASYGDILRAGKGAIPVNRNFTFLKGKQFVKAREIFREKPNINEIPVVDAESRLLGMCSRNDDLKSLKSRCSIVAASGFFLVTGHHTPATCDYFFASPSP